MKLNSNNNDLSRNWFILSVVSLAISGLFAVFLVISRSPHINEFIPHANLFKSSLSIHVNLSVTVWLLGMVASMFTYELTRFQSLHRILFILSCVGTALITISIFDNDSVAYLNNYVPFIDSVIFTKGIYLFLIGTLFSSFLAMLEGMGKKQSNAIILPALIIFSSVVYFTSFYQLEYDNLKDIFNREDYFENLFWGTGHMIQFAYVQAAIFGWLILLGRITDKDYSKYYIISGIMNMIFVILGMLLTPFFTIDTAEYKIHFTDHMIYLGGISIIYVLLATYKDFISALRSKLDDAELTVLKNCLLWSLILFITGGLLGFNIDEINTVVPAHYHGSIVGISLSLMGLSYIYCKKFGFKKINYKAARVQPILYGSGQLIHIIGFALSGGYGAMRKNPGTLESFEGQLYMGLMGIGGLISIIGGLFFVIIIIKAIKLK